MCSEQTCGNYKHFRAGAVSAPFLRPLRNPPAEKPGLGHQDVRPVAGKGPRLRMNAYRDDSEYRSPGILFHDMPGAEVRYRGRPMNSPAKGG